MMAAAAVTAGAFFEIGFGRKASELKCFYDLLLN
jgi:hypothetical protein